MAEGRVSGSRSARRVARAIGASVAGVGLVTVGLVALASPAFADGPNFAVTKTVVGIAPSGTTFQVAWSCTDDAGDTLSFSATGGTMQFAPFTPEVTCSVIETSTGGAANVGYHCDNNGNVTVTCSSDGKSATVSGVVVEPAATFTVTNAYSNFFSPPVPNPNPATPGAPATITGTGCTKGVFGGPPSTGGTVTVTIGFNPPITLGPAQAQGGSGNWSFTFTVPSGTPPGSYPVNAVCNDPVPYPAASLVVSAAPPPLVAAPAFTG